MKKLLSLFAILAISSSLVVNAAESIIENYVNQKLSPITSKEKAINSKIESQMTQLEAKRAEIAAQKAAADAEAAARKAESEARRAELKKAVESEVSFWKRLFGRK